MKSIKYNFGSNKMSENNKGTFNNLSSNSIHNECIGTKYNLRNESNLIDSKNKKIILFNKKYEYEDEDDYIDNEVDEAVKEDYDADEDDNYEINEVIIDNSKSFTKKLSSKIKKKDDQQLIPSSSSSTNSNSNSNINNCNSSMNYKQSTGSMSNNLQNKSNDQLPNQSQSDSTSSNESGFGTVDDEIETHKNANENNVNTNNNSIKPDSIQIETKLEDNKLNNLPPLQQQNSLESNSSNHPFVKNNCKDSLQQFPILQPPKQVVYELNLNNSDDVVNILNDNSSINSSISSSSNNFTHCCSKLIEKIITFYYNCFCCYSSSSHNNHTPLLCSWLTIFCCCCPFLGGISLYLTHRSKKYKLKQKYDLADKYSNYAEKLNIAALIFGVIFYAIAFFMITLVLFMYWRPNHS